TALGKQLDHNGVAPVRYVDSWLYVGPADTMTETSPAPSSLEPSYTKELERRSIIEWGDLRVRRFLGPAAAR
ncbi:MAG TPA: hypothetical protein VKD65_03445, partial [Candidatus Angelobacter sp.]|nr:hypothetical protein [Candidatus Angelobacter sp.]